jgi:hypothetical protein
MAPSGQRDRRAMRYYLRTARERHFLKGCSENEQSTGSGIRRRHLRHSAAQAGPAALAVPKPRLS